MKISARRENCDNRTLVLSHGQLEGYFSSLQWVELMFFCLDFPTLEYIPTIPPQSTYVMDNCFILFDVKKARVLS